MSLFPLFGSALVALIVGIAISSGVSAAFSKVPLLSAFSASVASRIPHGVSMDNLPQQAQLMLPASWAAMETVPVPGVADFRTVSAQAERQRDAARGQDAMLMRLGRTLCPRA